MSAWADNPQAAAIDAVIARAGRLTDAQIVALSAVRVAIPSMARSAAPYMIRGSGRITALSAIQEASRMAIRQAIRDTVWGTPLGGVRGPTRGAVYAVDDTLLALLSRDLIDESTSWTQCAYDSLTLAWATVIGPAHPDDVQETR